MIPIIFDLDGVIADNVSFEEHVTDHIIRRLSRERTLTLHQAHKLWIATLERHRRHPRWNDYGLHCEALGLGDFWQQAHRKCCHLLRKYPGIDRALKTARGLGACWLASDATAWVVEFKLSYLGLADCFLEVFTVDRCSVDKGKNAYWRIVAQSLPDPNTRLLYVDNRFDRVESALHCLPGCRAVWVEAPDHPVNQGFGSQVAPVPADRVVEACHTDLAAALHATFQDWQAS